jgi:ubiquitin-protein ligase E3 C
VTPLSTFCSLYNLFLLPILDEEFLRGEAIFSKADLIQMSNILKNVCLGIICLMHPETNSSSASASNQVQYSLFRSKNKFSNSDNEHSVKENEERKKKAVYFTRLFQVCSLLVQRMHTRDIRFGFCSEDHWVANTSFVSGNRLASILETLDPSILSRVKFCELSYLSDEIEMQHKLSIHDIRSLTILQELPFTVPFKDRVHILEHCTSFTGDYTNTNTVKVRVRREYLYEDAFDNLSIENVNNLKTARIVVEMINKLGLDEAGIDGGGLFREFILELLESGFDPNRGFFILTSDGYLYPNPNVKFLMLENYEKHYFFLGRILAKVIYKT